MSDSARAFCLAVRRFEASGKAAAILLALRCRHLSARANVPVAQASERLSEPRRFCLALHPRRWSSEGRPQGIGLASERLSEPRYKDYSFGAARVGYIVARAAQFYVGKASGRAQRQKGAVPVLDLLLLLCARLAVDVLGYCVSISVRNCADKI